MLTDKHQRLLIVILLLGLVLRLGYALAQDHTIVYLGESGDSEWYMTNGYGIWSGQEHGATPRGLPFYNSTIPSAPLYLVFTGFWQKILPEEPAVIAIRITQCILSILIAYFGYRIARKITDNPQSALIVAGGLAFHPSFIIDAAQIATETLYIFWLMAGMWTLIWAVTQEPPNRRALALAGILFGLATLTRAVALLFPAGLIIYFLLIGERRKWRTWLQYAVILLVAYVLTSGTWTAVNLIAWNRLVIGSSQMMPTIWRGAVTTDGSPQQNDAQLIDPDDLDADCEVDCGFQIPTETYVEQITDVVQRDIGAYIRLRVSELGGSLLQPHATILLGGESVRSNLGNWFTNDRSLTGLGSVIQSDWFIPKSFIFIFHYGGLVFGLIGMWILREKWRLTLPLIGFIAYTIAVHFVLLAVPRYLFPTQPFLWILAGVPLLSVWDWFRQRRTDHKSATA